MDKVASEALKILGTLAAGTALGVPAGMYLQKKRTPEAPVKGQARKDIPNYELLNELKSHNNTEAQRTKIENYYLRTALNQLAAKMRRDLNKSSKRKS